MLSERGAQDSEYVYVRNVVWKKFLDKNIGKGAVQQ
jgi:hypothetical protein